MVSESKIKEQLHFGYLLFKELLKRPEFLSQYMCKLCLRFIMEYYNSRVDTHRRF